jgi:type IV pilus assembly protein PilO
MALADFRLANLPRSAQILLFVGVAAALSYMVYSFYFQGMIDERTALQDEIKKLETSVAQGQAVASQLPRFKEELARLEERLAELSTILPSEKETPIVLRSVLDMASSSNLKIMRFAPKPTVPRNFYVDWPIEVSVQGSYNALGRFFEKVSQYARIINVDNIGIKTFETGTNAARTVSAVCTATTFVFREEQVETGTGN